MACSRSTDPTRPVVSRPVVSRPVVSRPGRSGCRGLVGMLVGVSIVVLAPDDASAAVVPAELVAREGDIPMGAGEAVAVINRSFALADGTVAFAGTLSSGDGFVFIDDQIVWLNSDELGLVLGGAETAMGASAAGGFIYGPTVDGDEAVWTHNGLLALENTQAPVFPAGVTTTFHSRPSMIANGTAYWISGINASGGTSTEQRLIYRSPTAMPGDIEVVLSAGDMVGGLLIDSPNGIDFDYQVSNDEAHMIVVLLMDTGSLVDDGHIYVNGALLHQEDTPNGSGDNWDNFDLVAINNQGHYLVSGDTNGDNATDEFLAVDGVIQIREGDMVDGITLTSGASMRVLAINDIDRVAHAWQYDGGGPEVLFYACDVADVSASSLAVLMTGVDELDFDGDGVGDALVTDIAATSSVSGRALTDDESIYLEVDIDDGGGEVAAMVRIPVTCCGNMLVDDGEECDDNNGDDSDECPGNCLFATCGDGFVWAGMEDCDDGNGADTDGCLSSCVPASCGDGFLWAGVEECDDANGDDTDECPSSCELASCGDGFVWTGIEECDDANGDDTDACVGSCVAASCGDGFSWAGVEECDDGNTDDGDGCASDCTLEGVASESSSSGGESSGGSEGSGTSGSTGMGPAGSSSDDGLTSGSGGVDSTGGSTGGPTLTSAGSSGQGSSGDTGAGAFPGLDDDGGCTCRGAGDRGSEGWRVGLALLLFFGVSRRGRRDGAINA